ncbi:MAG TPA: NAD-dependent epimerase/dehydratase family protein [Planctomycetota bacterium]|nr:NAD-dependent epimerase/dehydratase family protein [Planctomycetota bacterium]
MTSALVTGASGFVGGHLVRELRRAGWRVLTASRHQAADLCGDLLTIPFRGKSADVVFHLAGFSNPQASVDHAAAAFDANAATTGRIVREFRAGRFIIASSCQVYGPRPEQSTESTPLLPRTPYAASKLCGEALALASGRDVVILRPYNHTGPGQSADFLCPGIARQIARAEAGRAPAEVRVRSLAPRLDFFDVRDMARAYRLASERGQRGAVYNVATGAPVSIGDLVRRLVGLSRIRLRIRGRQGAPDLSSGNSARFRADTGWRPEIPLDRTLADLVDYERAALAPKAAARA